MLSRRRFPVFIIDTLLIALALTSAFLLRYDFAIPADEMPLFWTCLLVMVLAKPPVFALTGFYRSIWRYASLHDAVEILKGVTLASFLALFAIMFLKQLAPLPRSVFILDWFLLMTFLSASRLVWRVCRESRIFAHRGNGLRTLIVGAGEAGSLLYKEICRIPGMAYQVIGFVDDDPAKIGMSLHGVPVLGATRHLRELIDRNNVTEVIIAMPSAGRRIIRSLVESCQDSNVIFKTLPGIGELIDGTISFSQIKNVEIEDLLGREPVVLDHESICGYLAGKRVLVTGAAGSIGSEICRQVALFRPDQLILMDQAETPLYEIEKELTASFPELRILPLLADVRDRHKLEVAFRQFTPEVVFHAAAYKHVTMLEYNPSQAILNNLEGTKNVADMAHLHNVNNFVLISTDKAVNPTNVLGASKRAAELYVQSLSLTSHTRFTTVRFGNVLGSNGSVIPLFKSQIAKGGPVTVTDRQVVRYFMTISEAAQLVLQAGGMGTKSEILVLDMGEPVRILDLAEKLIRLSGLQPYEDIDIVFTGLRPGEKLYEELFIDGEGIIPTSHRKIKMLAPIPIEMGNVGRNIEELFAASRDNRLNDIIASLKGLVPEFNPAYNFTGKMPVSFKQMRSDLFPLLSDGFRNNKVVRLHSSPASGDFHEIPSGIGHSPSVASCTSHG